MSHRDLRNVWSRCVQLIPAFFARASLLRLDIKYSPRVAAVLC